jgi:dienelactone hydrolase
MTKAFLSQPRSGVRLDLGRIALASLLVAVEAADVTQAEPPASTRPSGILDFPEPAQLPVQALLPDPLTTLDGRKVNSREMWVNERRPELIRLFEHYMYGKAPPKPAALSSKVERVDSAALGGKATLTEVTLNIAAPADPLGVAIHLLLVTPKQQVKPAPVVLGINYFGNHTLLPDRGILLNVNWMPERGAGVVANRATDASRGTWTDIWRVEELIDRGYALATFYNGDVDPDSADRRGLQNHFRQPDPADDCGSIAAWAWGLQRAVDYLITVPEVDSHRIVVTGHSRMGKAALLAAAFDERIALAIPHQAGCGGSAPSRARIAIGKTYNTLDTPETKRPETVKDLNEKFPHWFNARFKQFDAEPERLPFDQNGLVALCAPRPVLFTNGRADTWINPAGQFEVLRAAAPVYRLLGAGDFTAEELPADGKLIDGTLGYFLRSGGHSLRPDDWKVFLDFADKHLGPP